MKITFGVLKTTLLSIMCLSGSMIVSADGTSCKCEEGNIKGHHHHHDHDDLVYQFRKWQAFQIVQDNAAQVHHALDLVLDASGPTDPEWIANIDFVLGLQFDQNNMSVQIDQHPLVTNYCEFKNIWTILTGIYAYRKRNMTEWILDDASYVDRDGLRTITAYALGQNFNILSAPVGGPFPPPFTSKNSYSNDRFMVTLQEVPPEVGKNCNFNFRIKKVVQITEEIFPLPDGPAIQASSPFDPPANPIPVCPPVFPLLPCTP